jgi:hypothetical protein
MTDIDTVLNKIRTHGLESLTVEQKKNLAIYWQLANRSRKE